MTTPRSPERRALKGSQHQDGKLHLLNPIQSIASALKELRQRNDEKLNMKRGFDSCGDLLKTENLIDDAKQPTDIVIDDPFDALFHSQILEPTRKDDDMSSLGDEFLDDAAGFETASTVDPTDDDDDDVDVGVLEQPEEQIRVFLDSAVDNEAAALRFRSYSSDNDVEI